MSRYLRYWILLSGFFPALLFAGNQADHHDPVAPVILWVTLILFFAILGRYIARRFNQPGVLGELLIGVFLGNLCYLFGSQLVVILREGSAIFNIMREMLAGISLPQAVASSVSDPYYAKQVTDALGNGNGIDLIKVAYVLDIFSRYGVIFLLFMVGLESSVEELKHTGRESVQVAIIGVIVPIILGFAVAHLMLPKSSYQADLFVAATLSATSIGITARVLAEMKKLRTREARTILGAAMIDDILGLVILAIVSSVVISGVVDLVMVGRVIISATLFFIVVITLGPWVIRKAVSFFKFLELWEAKLFISFIFVMLLAWIATLIHLATIIGAFAAGLIIHDGLFESRTRSASDSLSIHNLVAPLESILAPLFFILIGIQVKLESFWDWQVLLMASGLIAAAVVGKLVSGLGADRKDDRLLIGIGMLPRGEVGLIFASIGRTLGVMSDQLFSAIVLMVIVTTVIAPPFIKARYGKSDQKGEKA
ncbi:cation:proton antiporter [Legionella donaldsonii]|uniref:cation:proton antiporter n=1 Tax=Legionella donaldsonii TaxID=45060 RepID=UPI00399CD60B